MKQKLLHRNDSEPTAKGFAYDEDVKSTMIADFSAVDVFYQEAARIAFWEGSRTVLHAATTTQRTQSYAWATCICIRGP